MNFVATTYICAIAIISQSDASFVLPSSVTPCKRNDPDLSACWRSNLEKVRKSPKEFETLHVPAIDPWRLLPNVTFSGDTFDVELGNIEYLGVKNFKVADNIIDLPENRIMLKLYFQELNHFFTIISNGSMLNYTLNRLGCVQGYADIMLTLTLKGVRKLQYGREYISFNNVTINVGGRSYREECHDIVVGGPYANKKFNDVVAKNSDHFFRLYFEVIRRTIGYEIS